MSVRNKANRVAPRTAARAKRMKLPEVAVDFKNMDVQEKMNWIFFDPPGQASMKGALAAIRPPKRTLPAGYGTWVVCYWNGVDAYDVGCHLVDDPNAP